MHYLVTGDTRDLGIDKSRGAMSGGSPFCPILSLGRGARLLNSAYIYVHRIRHKVGKNEGPVEWSSVDAAPA